MKVCLNFVLVVEDIWLSPLLIAHIYFLLSGVALYCGFQTESDSECTITASESEQAEMLAVARTKSGKRKGKGKGNGGAKSGRLTGAAREKDGRSSKARKLVVKVSCNCLQFVSQKAIAEKKFYFPLLQSKAMSLRKKQRQNVSNILLTKTHKRKAHGSYESSDSSDGNTQRKQRKRENTGN